MTIDERIEYAHQLSKKGCTCSQAVACSYADLLDVDESVLFRISEGFGGGMGGMMGTCGAVTAMYMIAGLYNSCGDKDLCSTKGSTMKMVRMLAEEFKNRNQSTVCRELKGIDTHVVLRSCPGCVEDGVRILWDLIFSRESEN